MQASIISSENIVLIVTTAVSSFVERNWISNFETTIKYSRDHRPNWSKLYRTADIERTHRDKNIKGETYLKTFFESPDDPPGFALRSSGCSLDCTDGESTGRSTLIGVLTDGLAMRSGVVEGDICCWNCWKNMSAKFGERRDKVSIAARDFDEKQTNFLLWKLWASIS